MSDPVHPLAVDHPYTGPAGSYFANGWHKEQQSWAEFLAEMGDADDDLNLLYRWDVLPPSKEDDRTGWEFRAFYVLQRKGITMSRHVKVKKTDLPKIEKWLASRWAHMLLLWSPLSVTK